MGTKLKTKTKTKQMQKSKLPFVSICTPTFNRRPFIPIMIKCFEHQTYPKDRIEWIIIDDGTDKIEDMVTHIPQVKYFKYNDKLTLGKKRNISHEKSIGDIIVYMDDDDYYPPERISHAVEMLQKSPDILCAGSSIMFIYYKHIHKMYQFGPYGANHATAATFAFKRKLLEQTKFEESACLAEERHFLKNYTIPFIQLDSMKTILVFSHNHNSFDKKLLLNQGPNNPYSKETNMTPQDFIKQEDILSFFMKDIDKLLNTYEPGNPKNKPDVLNQLEEIRVTRENKINEQHQKQMELTQISHKMNANNEIYQKQIDNMGVLMQELILENNFLKDKLKYLEDKLKKIISEKIQEKVQLKLNSTT